MTALCCFKDYNKSNTPVSVARLSTLPGLQTSRRVAFQCCVEQQSDIRLSSVSFVFKMSKMNLEGKWAIFTPFFIPF